jgi:regulator of sirC expression with transglutaminase-like and TPR domain
MEATERFGELLSRPETKVPLDEGALLIAAHAYPDLDVEAEIERLDRLADGCRTPTLDGLVRYLFVECGYRGNSLDYYDPRNSYLNDVTERRIGIPISLCVLTLAVGRRLGVPMSGVGMPGHFLLRDRVDPEVFVDPYDHGALIDRAGCLRIFRGLHGESAPFDPEFLEPVGARTILARMLANLKAVFRERGDTESRAWVLDLRCRIPDMVTAEFGEHAEALAALGRFDRAAQALEEGAARLDGDPADAWLATARSLRSRLN